MRPSGVERPIAPWPSVATSAQPHQSHSTATSPSRLMVGTSAKALPAIVSSRRVGSQNVGSQNVFTRRLNRWTYTGPLTQYK
eukprot:scaffold34260_cov49-Attheya_sp.AAC.1